MRITGLHVDGFGLLRDQTVRDVPPGITVVLGPNEAGKSTLHAFLVRTLFGHPRANDAAGRDRLSPLRGGHHGGHVSCEDDAGSWTVHRHTDRSPSLRVVAPDGTESTHADATLPLLGRVVDAARYEQVFAIDLDDLSGVGALGAAELDDLLFDAATVGTGRSLRAARDEAVARRDALWTPAATKRPLSLAVRRRADARAQLADAQDAARRNLDVRRRSDDAAARVEQLTEQQAQLAERTTLLERVRDAWPAWSRRLELAAELATLPADELAPVAVTTVREAQSRVDELEADLRRLEEEGAVVADRLASVEVDEPALAAGDRIAELVGRLGVHELTLEQLAAAERARDDARRTARATVAELGDGWDDARVREIAVDAATREQLAEAAATLTDAAAAVGAAEERAEEAARLAARREQQAHDRRVALDVPADGDALARREAAVAVLRAGVPTLAQAEVLRAARGATGRAVTQRLPFPPRLRRLGAVLLAVTVAGLLAALFDLVALPAAGVAVAALAAGTTGGVLLAGGRPGSGPTGSVDPDAPSGLVDEVARAAAVVGLDPSPAVGDVERVAASVAADRDAVRAAEQERRLVATAVEEALEAAAVAEQLGERAEVVTAQHRASASRWAELCARVGLDPRDGPRVTLVRHERITAAARALDAARTAAATVGPLEQRATTFRDEVAALAADLGAPCGPEDAVRLLPALRIRATTAAEAAAVRERLGTQVEQLDRQHAEQAAVRDAELARREAALETLGVASVEGLDAELAREERRRRLVDEHDAADRELGRLLGTGPRGQDGRALLAGGDPTAWAQELAAASASAATLRRTRDAALAERTELAAELERLGGDDAVARAQQRLTAVETELGVLAERWAVADAASRLLEETVARFEREQQPRVLARASVLFSRATRQSWREIRRLDDHVVVAREPGAEPVSAAVLSRGTREQLWLSLRLALAEDLSTERTLPLLVDDLLGTSDPVRAQAVVGVLAEVARSQQVWLFTCHPATARLVTETDPTAGVLELRDGVVRGWTSRSPRRQPSEDALRLDV